MFEPEAVHRDGKALPLPACCEYLAQRGAELLGQHIRRVNGVVGVLAQVEQEAALPLDALAYGHAVLAKRVAAATGLVTGDKLLVIGLEKHDLVAHAVLAQQAQLLGEILEIRAVARVAHDSDMAVRPTLAGEVGQTDDLADKAGGKVVDAEVAQILEHVHRLGAAGAAHARQDDELGHAGQHLGLERVVGHVLRKRGGFPWRITHGFRPLLALLPRHSHYIAARRGTTRWPPRSVELWPRGCPPGRPSANS